MLGAKTRGWQPVRSSCRVPPWPVGGRSLARPAWARPSRLAAGLGRCQVRLNGRESVEPERPKRPLSAVQLPPPPACSFPASVRCRPNSDRLERTWSRGGRGRCPEALAYAGRPAFVSASSQPSAAIVCSGAGCSDPRGRSSGGSEPAALRGGGVCEHHAPPYLRGWSPAWGRKPSDPALESRVTRGGCTPLPVGQVAGGRKKAGHRAFLVVPPQNEARPLKEIGLGLLFPWGSLGSSPFPFRSLLTTL